jgi:hypothetical protein
LNNVRRRCDTSTAKPGKCRTQLQKAIKGYFRTPHTHPVLSRAVVNFAKVAGGKPHARITYKRCQGSPVPARLAGVPCPAGTVLRYLSDTCGIRTRFAAQAVMHHMLVATRTCTAAARALITRSAALRPSGFGTFTRLLVKFLSRIEPVRAGQVPARTLDNNLAVRLFGADEAVGADGSDP